MILSQQQAIRVQQRRVMQGLEGWAKAVRRWAMKEHDCLGAIDGIAYQEELRGLPHLRPLGEIEF